MVQLVPTRVADHLFRFFLEHIPSPQRRLRDQMLLDRLLQDPSAHRVPLVGDRRRKVGEVDPLQVAEEALFGLLREDNFGLDETLCFGGEDLQPLRGPEELGDRLALQVFEGLRTLSKPNQSCTRAVEETPSNRNAHRTG